MTTDTKALVTDMFQFSALLHTMGADVLSRNYAAKAMSLQSDSSDQNVKEVRDWVRLTLKGGSGGLGDQYVQHSDGSVNRPLTAQYEKLLQRLTDFANGEQIVHDANSMWEGESTYFRLVEVPVRKGWFSRTGSTTYEVMTAPHFTTLVTLDKLAEAVDYNPMRSRKDFQECKMIADRLFREGRTDDWVHYSSSYVVPDKALRRGNPTSQG